ncbi:putative sugar nucleotidyl transferase [Pseudogemmatithrix spongiicola]|uniref:Sugar nucleotidyl transferase n=1 Tax=Pseudogemmatithrix spongiicola TaxID=3062599 RepID=A0AA49JU61_9BACT|nr:putative sugar nucleotidyl transferase [Gemmatimonadaceae bacterium 'strain 138']WKW15006.1 putative sugar nucleotidyl transferase [Gemmatimonadaceae bacterium 'strain 318']
MTGFVLYDDATARDFAPFALTRPAGELRAGAALTRERWTRIFGAAATGFVGAPHLRQFAEFDAPPAVESRLAAGTWLVNARCVPRLDVLALAAPEAHEIATLRCGGRVAAVRLTRELAAHDLADGRLALEALAQGPARDIDGWWLDHVWDLVALLPNMLAADATALLPAQPDARGIHVIGAHAVHVAADATIEPYVVADTSAGPIVIERGAHVLAFTRLVGPCVIGAGSSVMGGRLACCSIGPAVKVSGEMSLTIMIGHANKGHDGFVGHSVIGRWANLGAGTITSNLKNSYGEVTLWTPSGVQRTGQQFLGSLIGDHAKTGIGTRLSTGSVIGAAANVFGTRMPPKVVAPFAWGDGEPWETFALDRFLVVAARVMGRRGVTPAADAGAHWARVFAARDGA